MIGTRFLSLAALAFGVYGVLGLLIGVAMLVVGINTFNSIGTLSSTLERERSALVRSVRTAAGTLGDAGAATSSFQGSVQSARAAADQASSLANDSAGTFRDMGSQARAVNLFGIQPLGGLAPQFERSADDLQTLAISLGATREALAQNSSDIGRIGSQLGTLRGQLEDVARSLEQPGVLGLDPRGLLPFQVAVYGMCLLVILQAGLSIVAGIALARLATALGGELLLFPHITRERLPAPAPGSASASPEVAPSEPSDAPRLTTTSR